MMVSDHTRDELVAWASGEQQRHARAAERWERRADLPATTRRDMAGYHASEAERFRLIAALLRARVEVAHGRS